MGSPPLPGQPVPRLHNSFSKAIFPHLQSKPPLMQLEAISTPRCTPETYLLHPEGDFSGGHLQQGIDELAGDIHLHYLSLPRLAPHHGVAQQPLRHHLRARISRHPARASRASRKHAAFASRPTADAKDFDNLGQSCAVGSWPSTTSSYYCHQAVVTGLPNSPLS